MRRSQITDICVLIHYISCVYVCICVLQVEEYLSQNERSNSRTSRDPAEELVTMALDRWRRTQLRSDNISVLTVAFRVLHHTDHSPEREPPAEAATEEIATEEPVFSSQPTTKTSPLNATPFPSDDSKNLLRLPLNHLNHVRTTTCL